MKFYTFLEEKKKKNAMEKFFQKHSPAEHCISLVIWGIDSSMLRQACSKPPQ